MKIYLDQSDPQSPFVEITHLMKVALGADLFRIILDIRASSPASENGKLIKEYEIWVTEEALSDRFKLSRPIQHDDIIGFALKTIRDRYADNRDVPDENGMYIPNQDNVYFGHPSTFPLKTINYSKKIMTSIMLDEENYNWIKAYVKKHKSSQGELIRRLITEFRLRRNLADAL